MFGAKRTNGWRDLRGKRDTEFGTPRPGKLRVQNGDSLGRGFGRRAAGQLRVASPYGRGGRAGCARRLCRHALPEGVVARGFCETECASSRPYCRPDTTFALVGTLSKSGRPFFEWVLPTLVINHLGHIREFFLLAVNHSSNHRRGPVDRPICPHFWGMTPKGAD